MEDDYGTGECGSCVQFKRTRKVLMGKVKRWRGKCMKSGNLIGSWNISPCDSFEDNEESIQKKIIDKAW